jgi:hypothetical protein
MMSQKPHPLIAHSSVTADPAGVAQSAGEFTSEV